MKVSRGALLGGLVIVGAVLFSERRPAVHAQSPEKSGPIVGGWTLNRDLSDQQPGDRGQDEAPPPGNTGGGGRGGGGGGFGGGRRRGGGGGFGGGAAGGNPEDMARIREAMRDLMNPPPHLIIADTGSMIVMTAPDGRTTRLSPDGKKIKDDSTKIERKTKWDGDKLVSEINGVGQNKITQTFSADPDHHQLHIALQIENSRDKQPRTITQIYDADAR